MSSVKMSTSHIISNRHWPFLGLAFIGAVCFSFSVFFVVRHFRIPSSDAASIGLSFGIPVIVFFVVLQRGVLRAFSLFARLSLSGLFALVLAAATFWVAFIAAWALFGGTAP